MSDELEDTDPFPFGTLHKGTPMQDVPARYFHYLHTNGIHEAREGPRKAVSNYIKRNLSALQQEYRDGIW